MSGFQPLPPCLLNPFGVFAARLSESEAKTRSKTRSKVGQLLESPGANPALGPTNQEPESSVGLSPGEILPIGHSRPLSLNCIASTWIHACKLKVDESLNTSRGFWMPAIPGLGRIQFVSSQPGSQEFNIQIPSDFRFSVCKTGAGAGVCR